MLLQQISYTITCFTGLFQRSRLQCPQCKSWNRTRISRKRLITSLVECNNCHLRYRLPQDPKKHYFDFYQYAYRSSLATECPTPENLRSMLDHGFRNTEKNFDHRISILNALGVTPGQDLLDFGASWGYGTWQFLKHGYRTTGFEISQPRAKYGRENLGVLIIDNEDDVPSTSFDCFFSSHVLEHLPAPNVAFSFAKRVLRPGALFVAFTPNGSEDCRLKHPNHYDINWGRLHPLYLNAEFYAKYFQEQPYLLMSSGYGEKYDLESISAWDRKTKYIGDLSKRELLLAVQF